MNAIPNFLGDYRGMVAPVASYFGSAFGSIVKPGGRVAAYVRSTGLQEGDDQAIGNLLVRTIAEGVARCRPLMGDIVLALPGHIETFTASGNIFTESTNSAQIIGIGGQPGTSNNPTIVLANAGAFIRATNGTLANNGARGVTLAGFNISSSLALTSGVYNGVPAATGFSLVGNYIELTSASMTAPVLTLQGNNSSIVGNRIVYAGTGTCVTVATSSTGDFVIAGNLIRKVSTGTGNTVIFIPNSATPSGWVHRNLIQVAGDGVPASMGVQLFGGGASPRVGTFENYISDAEGGSGLITPALNDGN